MAKKIINAIKGTGICKKKNLYTVPEDRGRSSPSRQLCPVSRQTDGWDPAHHHVALQTLHHP